MFDGLRVVAVLAILLTGIVAAEVTWPRDVDPAPAAPLLVRAPVPLQAPPIDQAALLAAILARPLFDPRRRPAEPAIAAPPVAPDPPRLTGTIIGIGRRWAILADVDHTSREVTVAEGGQAGPWTVQAVWPGSVTLSGPDGPHRVQFGKSLPLPQPAPKIVPTAEPAIWGANCGRGQATPNQC